MSRLLISTIFLIFLISCGGGKQKPEEDKPTRIVSVPTFNSDSAYWFIEKQVLFGPRIPNTTAHVKTGDFLIARLKGYGAAVTVQDFDAVSYDGKKIFLRNIIASYAPEKQKRILIAAHWDTRPFADKDEDDKNATFEGANDGASGVGVLLEIARLLGKAPAPDVGIDLIFFDGEDWGERNGTHVEPAAGLDSWWCLGSQYWAKHKHKPNYSAYFGILLDMVGAKNAHFFQEGKSLEYAPKIVEKVWNTASRLGYSSIFVRQPEADILDDHIYVNDVAKIPTIDIVHYDPVIGYFGDFHHSRKDNMSLISKETLGAVGTVLMNVVYYEEP